MSRLFWNGFPGKKLKNTTKMEAVSDGVVQPKGPGGKIFQKRVSV